jgi:gas vesicle protein
LKDIQVRLSACQRNLASWSKEKFGKDAELLKQKSKRHVELQKNNRPDQADVIKQIQKDIDDILDREYVK